MMNSACRAIVILVLYICPHSSSHDISIGLFASAGSGSEASRPPAGVVKEEQQGDAGVKLSGIQAYLGQLKPQVPAKRAAVAAEMPEPPPY